MKTVQVIRALNLQDHDTQNQVFQLQRASYKVEAQLIGFDDIPPLKESLDDLVASDEVFYGYYSNDELAGIISYKLIGDVLDIHRLAVHPRFFRRGIAQKLLCFLKTVEPNKASTVVRTGRDNTPATKLYLKNGFTKVGEMEVAPGVFVTEFVRAQPFDGFSM